MQHTIAPTERGYQLIIWEPAPPTENRLNPYLYKVSLLFAEMDRAIEYLRQYQQFNQVRTV